MLQGQVAGFGRRGEVQTKPGDSLDKYKNFVRMAYEEKMFMAKEEEHPEEEAKEEEVKEVKEEGKVKEVKEEKEEEV